MPTRLGTLGVGYSETLFNMLAPFSKILRESWHCRQPYSSREKVRAARDEGESFLDAL